uniref:ribosomal protein S8 n=1 Tax=Strombomonas costata TaxID=161230 RepID=UPI0023AB0E8B|nr:ribosomal protein S8 [Strombomonas costata]WCH63605.1 ribosomal protein S8 [Strombomonas costata]
MVNSDLLGMLTRIRNSNLVKASKVNVIRTNLNYNVASILKKEGFIESFEESGDMIMSEKGFTRKYISITLKYKGIKQKPYITDLKRISKSGLRVYVNKENVPKVLGGIGIAVILRAVGLFYLSTSYGLLTDKVAHAKSLGGEVLFYIW